MSNTLSSTKVTSPENKQETVAHFSIDTPSTPFVMKNVVSLADDYVFSCFVKSDSTGSFKIGDKQVTTSNKWIEVKIPFSVSSNGNPDIAIYFTVNGQYYFYHTQVERGEVPTKWQPSPDDVDENIQSVSTTQQSSIEAMPGKIMAQVAEQYATKSDFSNITQRADSISSTVARVNNKVNDGSQIISTINQTAEEVAIKANKIDLNGIVTANNNFKILSDGSMQAHNGTFTGDVLTSNGKKLVGADGALSLLCFPTSGTDYVGDSGWSNNTMIGYGLLHRSATMYQTFKTTQSIVYYLPSNFEITDAWIVMMASGNQFDSGLGYPQQIAAFCSDNYSAMHPRIKAVNSGFARFSEFNDVSNQIKGKFNNSDTWTPSNVSASSYQSIVSSSVKSYISNGAHAIVFRTMCGGINDISRSNTNDPNMKIMQSRTGFFKGFLYVTGYMKIE